MCFSALSLIPPFFSSPLPHGDDSHRLCHCYYGDVICSANCSLPSNLRLITSCWNTSTLTLRPKDRHRNSHHANTTLNVHIEWRILIKLYITTLAASLLKTLASACDDVTASTVGMGSGSLLITWFKYVESKVILSHLSSFFHPKVVDPVIGISGIGYDVILLHLLEFPFSWTGSLHGRCIIGFTWGQWWYQSKYLLLYYY